MAKTEEKQEPKYRNMVSDTGSVFEQPLNSSLDPIKDWRRNGQKLEFARYFRYKYACDIRNEPAEKIFADTSQYDRFEGVVLYMKPGDKEVMHSGFIVKAEPKLKPSKLEEKAEQQKEFNIDKFLGAIDEEGSVAGVEPEIEEDNGTLGIVPIEPKYKSEPIKPGTKPQSGQKPKPPLKK